MAKAARKPFQVKLKKEQREQLAIELARALDDALSARSVKDGEVAYWHTLYEQGRTRGKNAPWADAADLTSYLGTMYVDVMRAEITDTVMTEPVFTVEGYGDAESKAPFVEEFHQWQIEAEGFQQVFSRAMHIALIEPRGVIEVYEDTIRRPVRKVIKAQIATAPDGTALLNEQLKPVLAQNPDGSFIEVHDEATHCAEVEIDAFETVCRGPRERVIASRDYLELPGHAQDKSDIWGRAKRFYRRVDELQERAKQGVYDEDAVEALGTDDERASETTLSGENQPVAAKEGTDHAEKELWELQFLRDLDGKGLRWFVATVHKDKQVLLRLQHDDIGRPRYFPLVPFPKPNSTEGYSYIGHKLITVIEEHTAWRNMVADDGSIQLNLPIKRRQGALWMPDLEPIGPKAVITVREPNEVEFMDRQSNNAVGVERIRDAERAGERLSGINDASAGVTPDDKRTAFEVNLITQQSKGRVSEVVKNIQETLEEIAQVRHLMWKRALAEMGQDGVEAPPSVLQGLEMRGVDVTTAMPNRKFTALMLEGAFRFKPRGSVETADPNRLAYNLNSWFTMMTNMATVNPMIGAILGTPEAARALVELGVRVFKIPNKQAFLGSAAVQAMQQAQIQQQVQRVMGVANLGEAGGTAPATSAGGAPPPSTPPPAGAQAS